MNDVAIIGGGMTVFQRRLKETGKELSYLATKMALEEAGITKKDIDMVIVSTPDSVVKATLGWPDPPGNPPAPAVDPPDLMLVNDLDLRIVRGANTWMPWVLNPASPASAASNGDNVRDNVEQVYIANPTNGY